MEIKVSAFLYVINEVPLKIIFSLLIAVILNKKLRGINVFRTAYYIPSILGSNVAIAVLWKFIFQSDGLANQVIQAFGGQSVSWFGDSYPALLTIVLLRVWEFGSIMVIFLAGLQSIPTELYEAASIEGCSKLRQFFRITIPLLSPTIFYNLVMQLISAFQKFNGPYLITKGGPQNVIWGQFKALDSYIPLVLPHLFASDGVFVFLLIQFFRSIPKDLDEAAKIDGCNSMKTLTHILVPVVKLGIVSIGLFSFMWSMNDFLGPLIYVSSVSKYPVTIALRMSMDATGSGYDENQIIAMSIISIIPSIIVFALGQKQFVEGLTAGSIKG